MKYVAITRGTASWLLQRPKTIRELAALLADAASLSSLTESIFAEGAFRMAASHDSLVTGVWNEDYLSGTGTEAWGFVRTDELYGISAQLDIIHEVFARAIAVINARLERLLIDQSWFFRTYPGLRSFSVSAGGGEEARRWTISYVEDDVATAGGYQHAVLVVGPNRVFDTIASIANGEVSTIPILALSANSLLNERQRRPLLAFPAFSELRRSLVMQRTPQPVSIEDVDVSLGAQNNAVYDSSWWSYDEWMATGSTLTQTQRDFLENDAYLAFPVRLIGPAGSGKSLLMQLLAIRRAKQAAALGQKLRLLYVVHNTAMARGVCNRFEILGASTLLDDASDQVIVVTTLADYALSSLRLPDTVVISRDAEQTKQFQLELVREAIVRVLNQDPKLAADTLFESVSTDPRTLDVASRLIVGEISSGIKGHGYVDDERRYVESEMPLTRLHGIMTLSDRQFVFKVFQEYHYSTFETLGVLDSDDLALSLLGTLRTPIWSLRRQEQAFDHVLIDEAQLFNDNERKTFSLLTRGKSRHVPVVVAMDQAQEKFGQTTAGLSLLGIEDIHDEALQNSQRCSSAILDLAFFIIERTVDLFDATFPKFVRTQETLKSDSSPLAEKPRIERPHAETSFAKFIVRRIQEFRAQNIRQIAVICHADEYWETLKAEMFERVPYARLLLERGEELKTDEPLAILTKPEYVGGQEFDAVICVGLEDGLTPPRFRDNVNVQFALEQQAYREMYLAVTRARFKVVITLPRQGVATEIIRSACVEGLVIP